jgi:hypothetical protein
MTTGTCSLGSHAVANPMLPYLPGASAKFLFIVLVDAIFTTLFERLFTNVLDVIGAKSAKHCLCRACHAD